MKFLLAFSTKKSQQQWITLEVEHAADASAKFFSLRVQRKLKSKQKCNEKVPNKKNLMLRWQG